jgi:predicted nucleic acid-binding protein
MSGKPFLDTNVVAYALTNDARKKAIAEELLARQPCISVQVVNELVNVCVRKLGYSREAAIAAGRMVMQLCNVLPLDSKDVEQAFQLSDRFGYSHWDALILAAAVRQGCDVLYSEDMQHGQEIGGVVRIENPFAQ